MFYCNVNFFKSAHSFERGFGIKVVLSVVLPLPSEKKCNAL